MSRSDLADFPHFTYANFIRPLKPDLTRAKLILNTLPNSLGTGANCSITEGDIRLIKEAEGKLLCTSSVHNIAEELHLSIRLMEQHHTQQHSTKSYWVWNIAVSKKKKRNNFNLANNIWASACLFRFLVIPWNTIKIQSHSDYHQLRTQEQKFNSSHGK